MLIGLDWREKRTLESLKDANGTVSGIPSISTKDCSLDKSNEDRFGLIDNQNLLTMCGVKRIIAFDDNCAQQMRER